jgi:c-di-GMP-binding flagellar brake protein YcgR
LDSTTEQHLRINRRHRRIEIELPCEAGLPGESQVAVQLLNLSVGGMKFQCGLQEINSLLPEEQRIPGTVSDVMLEVRLKLKTGEERAAVVNGRARLVHYERLAQDRFHVGVEFASIDKAQQRKLEDYINDRMREAETAPVATPAE